MTEVMLANVSGLKASVFKEDKFDLISTTMSLTTDTEIQSNKTYYQKVDEYTYIVVANPIVSEISSYYEVTFLNSHEHHFRDGDTWHGDHYTESDPAYKPGLIDGYKALLRHEIKDEQGQSYNPPKYSYPRGPEDDDFAEYAEQFKDYDSYNTPQGIKAGTMSLPPLPESVIGTTAGVFVEKPVFLPVGPSGEESVIFPLTSGITQLYGYKTSSYLPLDGDEKMTKAAASSIPSKDYDNTTLPYKDDTYKEELIYTYKGSYPYSNQIINLLSYDTTSEIPWYGFWKKGYSVSAENSTMEFSDINPILSSDGVLITADNSKSDIFMAEFTLTESKTVNFSVCFRCLDQSKTTYVQGPYICTKSDDSSYQAVSQASIFNRETSTIKTVVSSTENRNAYQVTGKWQRLGTVATLDPGTYYVIINWALEYIVENSTSTVKISNDRSSKLKVAGILLSEGSNLPPYDYRSINKTIESTIYRPAIFDVNTPMVKTLSTNKDWTIIYDRRILDNPTLNNLHVDRLGLNQYMWGYRGSSIFAGTDETPVTSTFEPAEATVNDFYNVTETVILQHDSTVKTLTITTYAPGKGSYSYYKHTEVINNVTTIKNFKFPDKEKVTYQLQLGGTSPSENTGDCYRCLVLIPFATDISNVVDQYLGLSEVDGDRVMLRNHYIEEGV